MKKKLSLKKKTIRKLQLKLNPKSDRKVAPEVVELLDVIAVPSNGAGGAGCTRGSGCAA
jgi:hypothetical protein